MATPIARKRLAPSYPYVLSVETDGGIEQVGVRLSFDFNALVLVEDRTGYGMLTGAIWKGLSANNLSVLLWAALQANHPEYAGDAGLVAVRSMLSLRNSEATTDALQEAYMKSLPDDQQAKIKEAIEAIEEAKRKAQAGNAPGSDVPLATSSPTA